MSATDHSFLLEDYLSVRQCFTIETSHAALLIFGTIQVQVPDQYLSVKH